MCGIAGILTSDWPAEGPQQIIPMIASLRHRGPDDSGHWWSVEDGVALGHRRLSIIDLSPAGRQPMESFCGRYQLTYNGEIYNYAELRSQLESAGATFRGQSDSEVLAAGISVWGVAETARRAVGMWAFAAWDVEQKQLTLARDRLGIKPLYYYFAPKQGLLLFASEMKPFHKHPLFGPPLNRAALAQFLRYGYVPGPATIFADTFKLVPGTTRTFRNQDGNIEALPLETYWSLDEQVCQQRPEEVDPREVTDRLRELLRQSVGLRMVSDVPLGAFLSGGIDSSLVVATMQQISTSPVKTFSIGFEMADYDEAPHARAVAAHLGTDHHELYVTPEQAREVIPTLAEVYDEPFADSSQIPTILVSRLAREHVTVSLSGDGGDELFGGYRRYSQYAQRWRQLSRLPRVGRWAAAQAFRAAGALTPGALGEKLRIRARIVNVHSPSQLYAIHHAHWKNAEQLAGPSHDWDLRPQWSTPDCRLAPEEIWMAADTGDYLPNDILTKVDRASMSVGLEARVPLLDHRLVEFAWSLPLSARIRDGQPKWPLQELLAESVPPSLFDRPKMGFGVPIGEWLRGPLRDWADDMLSESRLNNAMLLNRKPITRIWQQHRSGQQNWEYMLWDVLMLCSWFDQISD